ncbi:uncharacterized protein [Halyomorpha halys]|uniref:uncharacterized protein n=1 Tax=Halyomorpha halys TaxID=286706 RepID=UPI000D0C955E|nr:uncharacterized protein LOC106677713 [Halyomorpha halys]
MARSECMSTGKNGDSLTDSSVTSYSTVVIHHPQGKKGVKDSEEGRSQAYYKVKKLKTTEQPKIQGDFRPSQYFPESETDDFFKSMESIEDSRNSAQVEYREGKEMKQDSEMKRMKFKDEDRSSEETNWRQNFRLGGRHQIKKLKSSESSEKHEPRKAAKQTGQESKEHLEVLRDDQRTKTEEKSKIRPKHEGKIPISQAVPATFGYEFTNSIPAIPIELAHPFGGVNFHQQRLQSIPPPGMSPELIQTLLSQQPQTFDSEKFNEQTKKSKSQNFKVGYSIGFGGDEIVLGKPKDVRLHVNGRNSVWKTLTNGVEMSTELDKKKPIIEDSAVKASDSVLKNDVYYMNNYKLDTSVPTAGRNTFDHAQALTGSNIFDFSNAVEPGWFQQHPVELDMAGLYQSFGYPSPLPVYIPGPKGSGAMVQAIVIPVQSLPGIGWPSEQSGHGLQGNLQQHQQIQQIQLQPAPQPIQLQPAGHQPVHLHSASQRPQLHQPIQFQSTSHQPMQLQSATHQPFHLVPLQYTQVIPMQQQHQAILQAIQMPIQLKAHVQQLQPSTQHNQRSRNPKVRDSLKQSTFETSPIVVAAAPSDQAKLQHELNAILAEEMKRKNQRHPSVGLRPPLPF